MDYKDVHELRVENKTMTAGYCTWIFPCGIYEKFKTGTTFAIIIRFSEKLIKNMNFSSYGFLKFLKIRSFNQESFNLPSGNKVYQPRNKTEN